MIYYLSNSTKCLNKYLKTEKNNITINLENLPRGYYVYIGTKPTSSRSDSVSAENEKRNVSSFSVLTTGIG